MVRQSVVMKVVVDTEVLTLSHSLKINLTIETSEAQLPGSCDKPADEPHSEVPVLYHKIRS